MAGKVMLYKLVVLGDGGVGKTALVDQFITNHFVESYDPTGEVSYRKLAQIDGTTCMIEVVLTTGQEEYVALNDILIRDGEAFMLVYSISSRSSFASIRRFHAQVMRVKESQTDSCSFICLVGNKSDKVTEREVSTEEGLALAKELECEFFEVSSKDGVNVEASFYGLVRAMRKQRTTVPKKPDSPRILREAAVLSQDQRRYHLWNRISLKFHFLTGLFRSRKPHRA